MTSPPKPTSPSPDMAAHADGPSVLDAFPRRRIIIYYAGTLINGTEFDSSYARREPIEFPLNRVIAGWTEGVQLMKEGSKFRFYIPSKLAYGPRGAGRDIGPNEALIFDVELFKVK